MASRAKKLKPDEVETYKSSKNRYAHIKTLRDIVRFKDVPFPESSEQMASAPFIAYANIAQPILAHCLFEFDDPNGSLNLKSSHRRQSAIATPLKAAEVKELVILRDELLDHLNQHFHGIARPPPLSGGDTARWSIASTMWLLVCLLNCLLRRFGLGADKIDAYKASDNDFLCAQLLVINPSPVMRYSLRTLQMTIQNILERLDNIQSFHPQLEGFIGVLAHRTAELICGGGRIEDGYDAVEWCSLIEHAHTNQKENATAAPKGRVYACTTEFVTYSMVWFVTINNYMANYYQLADVPLRGPMPDMSAERFNIAQTRAMSWFPSHALLYRVLEFFCEYVEKCVDDTYAHGLRNFCAQFETAPDQATMYRVNNKTDIASPADVMSQQTPNLSPVGKEYVKMVKYGISLKEWLHRAWNWQFGETRIRSDVMGINGFYMQLVVLYIISLYFYNKTRVYFRHRFVLYHRSPAFTKACHLGKRNGYPFIVQQFGWWTVFVPHRTDPRISTFPVDTTPPRPRPPPSISRPTEFRDADDDDDDEQEEEHVQSKEDDTGRSSALFGAEGDDQAFNWAHELTAIGESDTKGEDLEIDPLHLRGSKIPTELPTPEFCRSYDCETFLEAWTVWAIALLHVRRGVIDNTDTSSFLCDLFGWPRLASRQMEAAVDQMV